MKTSKAKTMDLSRQYPAVLQKHLTHPNGTVHLAVALGKRAMAKGLGALDLAKLHEDALIEILTSESLSKRERASLARRAGAFFTSAMKPMEQTRHQAMENAQRLNQQNLTLEKHARELLASNKNLKNEIVRRQRMEESLKKSRKHYAVLLVQSRQMQLQIRNFSHQILAAQEAERKEISRELHDQIAQTLTGINIHLAALKLEATTNTKGLVRKIDTTQRIVVKSVNIVHRFARDLRPTVLDDLGLIPALQSYIKEFTERTRHSVKFTADEQVEALSEDRRTVLYRVAQAALTNILQHAQAKGISIKLKSTDGLATMEIHDNGRAFDVERVLYAKRHKRLGILGMRERVEMVGGSFAITSSPGAGTTILVSLPFKARKSQKPKAKSQKPKAKSAG